MKYLLLTAAAMAMLGGSLAEAKNPMIRRGETGMTESMSLGQLTPTPSMWMYQQEAAAWQDPQTQVHKKAEFKAWQRQQRIAASQWYGISNSRPRASHTPFCDYYSPFWSGSSSHPYRWVDRSTPTIVIDANRDGYGK